VTLNLEGSLQLVRLSDFNEIWYLHTAKGRKTVIVVLCWCVHRGRWVMHDSMPHDPIQGQGQGASEVPKIALFKLISSATYSGSWQMTTNS